MGNEGPWNHWSSSPFPLPSSVSWNTFLWALTPKAHLNWHSSLILHLKVQFLWNLFFKASNELRLLQIFWDYTVLDYIFCLQILRTSGFQSMFRAKTFKDLWPFIWHKELVRISVWIMPTANTSFLCIHSSLKKISLSLSDDWLSNPAQALLFKRVCPSIHKIYMHMLKIWYPSLMAFQL